MCKIAHPAIPAIERRNISATPELRAAPDGADFIPMVGHAAKFNVRSGNLGGFIEQIAPGAFTKTIKEADVRLLLNHDPNLVLARSASGTLRLSEDSIGLLSDADMANTSYGQDLAVSMRRGDINQMSFQFSTIRDHWEMLPDDVILRTLLEVRLYDVSVVTFPAYEQTEASLRSAEYTAMLDALGFATLEPEERAALINTMATGKSLIDDDHLPLLKEARDRLDSLIAKSEKGKIIPFDVELAKRRLHLKMNY